MGHSRIRQDKNNTTWHHALGTSLHLKGLLDEAVAEYREAIRLQPKGGAVYSDLGRALEELGLRDAALDAFKKGAAEYRSLEQKYVKAPKLQGMAREAHQTALTLRGRNQVKEARQLLDLAISLQEAALQLEYTIQRRYELGDYRWDLAETLLLQGQPGAAVGMANNAEGATREVKGQILPAAARPPAAMLFKGARVWALCSVAVNGDEREKCAARAVVMLGQARDRGHFATPAGLEALKKEPSLGPLRQRADFQKLLAEVEAKKP